MFGENSTLPARGVQFRFGRVYTETTRRDRASREPCSWEALSVFWVAFWATVGEKIGVIVILGVKTAKLVGGHRAASIL